VAPGTTDEGCREGSDGLTLEDAFEMLGHEILAEIMRVLGEDPHAGLSFSTLRARVHDDGSPGVEGPPEDEPDVAVPGTVQHVHTSADGVSQPEVGVDGAIGGVGLDPVEHPGRRPGGGDRSSRMPRTRRGRRRVSSPASH